VTLGNVDLKTVGDRLEIIQTCLEELRSLPANTLDEFASDFRNPATAESLLRRAIQALFDLLRHLLSKRYGRGTLEYKETARLAVRKKLVNDPRLAGVLKELAGFRNRLIHFYDEVTTEELYGIVKNELGDLEQIAEQLRQTAARLNGI
jgi:uncharacterized protein YutE (UPF0331/DUF86 family)